MANEYRSRQERRQAAENGKQPVPKRKKKFPFFKAILAFIVIMFIIGTISVGVIMAKAPKLDPDKLKTPLSSQIYDKDGKMVTSLFSEQNRVKAGIKDIPPNVRDAFVAVEDVRFYKHHGVDVRRIFGAALANVTGGFGSQGGSTITQQVVKNTILTNQKSLTRKIQEAYLAIKLEKKYSKEQILEMYLNKIYFGHNVYGIGTAAKTYFDVDRLDQLTLPQTALLAGLPKAPSNYDPLVHPEAAEKRRNVVLGQMEKYGYITKAEADKAKATPVTKGLHKGSLQETRIHEAYLQQVIKDIQKMDGMKNVDVFADGLKIYTNMDTKAQEATEDVLQNASFLKNENKKLQSGIAIVDTKTGSIRAIGSGREENLMSAYYASGNQRQPGSTIKPILDYGPAIDHFKWNTGHILKDSPITINGSTIHNFNDEEFGEVSMRQALEKSENTPAVRTFMEVGEDKAVDFANKLGINIDSAPPAYAIGGFQKGITPLNLAGAYAAFGNEGVYNAPTTIRKIEFPNGDVVKPDTKPVKAMNDFTAYMITDMLKGVMKSGGTGAMANVPGLNLAGKTGTTNLPKEFRDANGIPKSATNDAWMAGYTPSYSAAVWTGYNSKKDNEGVHYLDTNQRNYSKLIFKEVMSRLNHDGSDFKKPNSVVDVTLEKGTNKKAGEFTPENEKAHELFVRGTEPNQVSDKYDQPASIEGLKAEYNKKKNAIDVKWNYKGNDKTIYKVAASVDGTQAAEQTIKDLSFTVPNAEAGKTYSFQVTAINSETNKESPPAQTSVTVPGEQPPAQSTPPDQNNPGDQNQGGKKQQGGKKEQGGNQNQEQGDQNKNQGSESNQPDQGGNQQGGTGQPNTAEPQNPQGPEGNQNGQGNGQGNGNNQDQRQQQRQNDQQFPALPDLNQ
ncbi:penicillin-binding protein 1A [Fictibacillus enclensis]|uniref:Fibronectin type-III domain-containing protein n=1 Tax=Fictibacillus enclensis TaxID=1017270 RepID=A0A0V8JF45_9BACL|nr:PBP1A family penicillin-binding protein [Fictibacillus enclensis]KSU85548.1 hypothetical protein AS030_08640 [Fictibacillus enclensis]SCB98638.1 penicillin-binding protein 1A [Fictibacillus enclensis]